MDLLLDLGIPKSHVLTCTHNSSLFRLLVHSNWLRSLSSSSLRAFMEHPDLTNDTALSLSDKLDDIVVPPWSIIFLQAYRKQNAECMHIPRGNSPFLLRKNGSLMFSQLLHLVQMSNYKTLWRSAWERYRGVQMTPNAGYETASNIIPSIPWDTALLEVIGRLYGCPVARLNGDCNPGAGSNLPVTMLGVHCVVETANAVFVFHERALRFNMRDCVTFSENIMRGDCFTRPLFVVYQVVHCMRAMHDMGLLLGDLSLDDLYVTDDLWLQIVPKLTDNLSVISNVTRQETYERGTESINHSLLECCHEWMCGSKSNYDYIMELNRLAGRVWGDPQCHYVFPWVSDLSQRNGRAWRDLKRSKFRLNKGDRQLDLTYEQPRSEGGRHHVSDILSPITYYVYMARRTPKAVLCRHVRSQWVPHEYPASVQRLYEWSPDECIPELYSDASIFDSVHDDMDDLEVPTWAANPADFVRRHHDMLESQHVSERLHHWIDLTFGYKLSGTAAVKAKNVCLSLVDEHLNVTRSGVVQLFDQPHPSRVSGALAALFNKSPPVLVSVQQSAAVADTDEGNSEGGGNGVGCSDDEMMPRPTIGGRSSSLSNKSSSSSFTSHLAAVVKSAVPLPKEMAKVDGLLHALEGRYAFLWHTGKAQPQPANARHSDVKHARRRKRDMLVLACLMVEVFMARELRAIGANRSDLTLQQRKWACEKVWQKWGPIPPIAEFVNLLFNKSDPIERGVPFPTAQLLLEPALGQRYIAWPHLIAPLFDIVSAIKCYESIDAPSEWEWQRQMSECQVKSAALMVELLSKDGSTSEQEGWPAIGLLLPLFRALIERPHTAVLTAWYLFEPMARMMGPQFSREHLLSPLARLFDSDTAQQPNIAKLYHHSFLLRLMVRFGLKCFLEHFCVPLVEAVGGNRDAMAAANRSHDGVVDDYDDDRLELSHSMAREATEEVEDDEDEGDVEEERNGGRRRTTSEHTVSTKVTDMSKDSLVWLAHRLGPVLTSRHLCRNLLKMLTLCYVGKEALEVTALANGLGWVVRGDANAAHVLECLTSIAGLYGEHMILGQYLPHMADIVALSRRKLSANLEGGLLAAVTLLHHMLPHLSDAVLMQNLAGVAVQSILVPIMQMVLNARVAFPNSQQARLVLVRKYAAAVYAFSVRLGREMTLQYFAHHTLMPLFCAFDDTFLLKQQQQMAPPEEDDVSTPLDEPELEREVRGVFDHRLAYDTYMPFLELLDVEGLEEVLWGRMHEHVRSICTRYEQQLDGNKWRSSVDLNARTASQPTATPTTSGGRRHLRGNWLAYWEHEIGQADNKQRHFDFKQIKLQSFSGHVGAVRCLTCLDNENSFVSGGRDKTVKLWSLRSQGDGDVTCTAQWTYVQHRRAVSSLVFVDGVRLMASCDGSTTLHLWDPFMGATVAQIDVHATGGGNVNGSGMSVVRCLPAPSALVYGATAEGIVQVVDTRLCKCVYELKVSGGSSSANNALRCMAVAPSGSWLAVGQTTGVITVLDTRTGLIMASWRAHDNEILQLVAFDDETVVTSSLDLSVVVWRVTDGHLKQCIRGSGEPAHCVSVYETELVCGTTANRIGVHPVLIDEVTGATSTLSVVKLKSDAFRGLLSAMTVLPLNRLLLLGADTGAINLLC